MRRPRRCWHRPTESQARSLGTCLEAWAVMATAYEANFLVYVKAIVKTGQGASVMMRMAM
jgi:hypothetical protein